MRAHRLISVFTAVVIMLVIFIAVQFSWLSKADRGASLPREAVVRVEALELPKPDLVGRSRVAVVSQESAKVCLPVDDQGWMDDIVDRERYMTDLQGLVDMASDSGSTDLLIAAALIEKTPKRRFSFISQALALNPENVEVLWHVASVCGHPDLKGACDQEKTLQELLARDSQNALVWMMWSEYLYSSGDPVAALAALEQASRVVESNSYWIETLQTAERAFAASTSWDFPIRATSAFGIATAAMRGSSGQLKMCLQESEASVVWANACLDYWRHVAKAEGGTEMDVAIANDIVPLMLEELGRSVEADDHRSKNAGPAYGTPEFERYVTERNEAGIYAVSTPANFSRYLELMRTYNEVGATRLMLEERDAHVLSGSLVLCDAP